MDEEKGITSCTDSFSHAKMESSKTNFSHLLHTSLFKKNKEDCIAISGFRHLQRARQIKGREFMINRSTSVGRWERSVFGVSWRAMAKRR
jgi:hypothetical protein